ncbi:hypothetical protein UMM65_08835 [Aureibaculum sp. 2210JD6-5]|uniref:LVIVD repeat-containing protein n=1 Tax=Aureibaculum sp. 2210JD6-5 TaxID=3103957 RepID=UPI002AACF231|nr:hypothetical protein [Aureibaculum sp. 2210JD6-5]MDY7395345.1 hypothetical protein [Aureibaculum sp. 2210JD6-5]
MKSKIFLLIVTSLFIFSSCNEDNGDYKIVNVATAKYMTKDALRKSVIITAPAPIVESGKIYAYKNLVLVNDIDKGIHIIDNSDPKNPFKIAFISIIANKDMEVKGDYLYADSLMDLLVFDISDLSNITEVTRLTDVFPSYIPIPFMEDLYIEYGNRNYNNNELIVGWDITQERKSLAEIEEMNTGVFFEDAVLMNMDASSGTTGQGGSLARFKIVNDYLYAVDSHNINIFNIDNLEKPQQLQSVFAGFDIETIFNKEDHLFLGSMRGMYVYNIKDPASPQLISEFEHGTACDPVVVDDNYAYITLRAGNGCGALDSSLQIVDITDIANPELKKSYEMDNPYGLGIISDLLFICDGTSGLKVYDKTDINNLKMVNHYKNIQTYDVIPLEEHLLMIGDKILYQYKYQDEGIALLSKFSLD